MITDKFNKSRLSLVPGYDNVFDPTAGTDGIRINIHEAGTV